MSVHVDTIFALSSGAGRAGIAVIRLSGPQSFSIRDRLVRSGEHRPGQLTLQRVCHPMSGELIDEAMVVSFHQPKSYTGEDLVELHVHGSRAVIEALSQVLVDLKARPAEPGEFTRRAFENEKLDLTEAEGLADLIAAETDGQRRQALRQLQGGLGRLYEAWRTHLVRAAALVEAMIDFPDEDLPSNVLEEARSMLIGLGSQIRAHLDDGRRGERLREGLAVAVVGAPNVGKSSLVNALAQRDVAIVSDISGTTRDVIEVHLDIGGCPVVVSDTAGLREAAEQIEAEGIRRARLAAEAADFVVFLLDGSGDLALQLSGLDMEPRDQDIVAVNKIDLVPDGAPSAVLARQNGWICLSARTGEGVSELLELLSDRTSKLAGVGESVSLTRQRHRLALSECLAAVERCTGSDVSDVAVWGEDVRLAVRALGRITGRTDVEDILDVVFGEFCIGK